MPYALDERDQVGKVIPWDALQRSLKTEAVDYYVRAYDVDRDEAARRLMDQARVIGLSAWMQQRLPERVGESWYDNEAGEWVVPVLDEGAGATAENLLGDVGLGGSSRTVYATRDRERERAAADATFDRLFEEFRKGYATAGMVEGRAHVELSSEAPREVATRVQGIAEELEARVSVVRGPIFGLPLQQIQCQFPYCNHLLGGVRVNAAMGCTAGFYVGPPGVYNPHLLTAGHCTTSGGSFTSCVLTTAWCPWSGVGTAARYYGGLGGSTWGDAGLLQVQYNQSNGGWHMYPGWWNWNPAPPTQPLASPVRAYYPFSSSTGLGGLVVCLNGSTSGSTCGTITNANAANQQTNPARYYNHMLFISGACSNFGDSGGPWTQASYEVAVGVHSAGACGQGDYAEPIGRALTTLNASIYGG